MNVINLKEIIENHRNNTDHYADQDFDEYNIKQICLEFGKQLLELAAKNVYIQDWYDNGKIVGKAVNKQSILDTINQVK